jgi:hypothetical protein
MIVAHTANHASDWQDPNVSLSSEVGATSFSEEKRLVDLTRAS